MTRIIVGFVLASLVALMFMGLTGFILFDDLINHAAPITIKHAGTFVSLVAVAYFGDRIWPEFKRLHVVTGLGCVALFVGGLAMCVFLSSGRNAALTLTKNADVRNSNQDRTTLQKALTGATSALDAAQASVAEAEKAVPKALADVSRFCPGDHCATKRRTLKDARDSVVSAAARLVAANDRYYKAYGQFSTRPAEQFENADIKAGAVLLSKLPYVTAGEDALESMLALSIPFLQSLMAEIALLVSLAIARGYMTELELELVRRKAARTVPGPPPEPLRIAAPNRSPEPSVNSAEPFGTVVGFRVRGRPMAEAKALAFVRGKLASGERFPSQDAIAERCSVAKSTVSGWMRKWEDHGTIARSRDGRCNIVSAGAALSV